MKQLDLFGPRPTQREIWAEDDAKLKLNSTVAPEDVPRLSAALQRLRDHMADGAWHTATELTAVAGRRYGARLQELSKAGYPHDGERLSGGEWRYRLSSIGETGSARRG